MALSRLLVPERRTGPELLDLPPELYTSEELEGSLSDIRAVNRHLGDVTAVIKHLSAATAGISPRRLTLLDVATGSADIPVALVEWAGKIGLSISITAVDINPSTIEIARERTAKYPEITVEVADGLDLPFADKSFDVFLCSKTLHHFTEEKAVRLMKEAMRVSRRGYVLMDLRRSRIAYMLIYVLTRLLTRNRLTRHDGPLSVLRSFTPGELASLASAAGASGFAIAREPFWLMVLKGSVT